MPSKKDFRPHVEATAEALAYPTHEQALADRRTFLAQLGLTLVGAGAFGVGLSACGSERSVGAGGTTTTLPPTTLPPTTGDAGPPSADSWELAGGAQFPEPAVDTGTPPRPDASTPGSDSWQLTGEAPAPDLGLPPPQPDLWSISGARAMPESGSPSGDEGEAK